MPARGRLIGLGVGPGDPELITLKALRLLRESPGGGVLRGQGQKGATPSASSKTTWWRSKP
jgi:precorrin-2/cobalt-factor-2 C20-methyltransferase